MIEQEKTQLFTELQKVVKLRSAKDLLTTDDLAQFWRALKEYPKQRVLKALDDHVKFGNTKYRLQPGDIVKRIAGENEKGEAKPTVPAKDRVCVYTHGGQRCPGATSFFTFGDNGYCFDHERHKDDPAHMQRILEQLLAHGERFVPATPHRQRAEYLWACGGAAEVLRGRSGFGPYDARYVRWLETENAAGRGPQAYSWTPADSTELTAARQELASRAHLIPEDEFEDVLP